MVLCSSQRAVLGGVGRMDYCAANAYLDAYAHQYQQEGRRAPGRVVTINWDTWRETGMAVETAARLGVEVGGDGLSSVEGVEAWRRIMSGAAAWPQLVVSTTDFRGQVEAARRDTAAARLAAEQQQSAAAGAGATTDQQRTASDGVEVGQSASPTGQGGGRHARPALSTPYVAARTPVEATLARIWAEALGLERVGVEDNFFELGGDSVLSLQITARANGAGLRLTPRQVFERQTVAELATVAAGAASGHGSGSDSSSSHGEVVVCEQGEVVGEVPLMPIQRWFFAQAWENPHHYNQAVLLEVRERLETEALREVVRALVAHHDGLRLRYEPAAGEPGGVQGDEPAAWRQHIISTEEALAQGGWFEVVDIEPGHSGHDGSSSNSGNGSDGHDGAADEHAQAARITEVAERVQRSLHLTNGPLLRVVQLRLGAGRGERLLVVVHHLAMDAISWRILLEDLEGGYRQARAGQPIALAAKTLSFKGWAEAVVAHVEAGGVEGEAAYWAEVEARRARVKGLPVDYEGGANRVASEAVVRTELTAEETRRLLVDVPQGYHTQITEVLLAGVVEAVGEWTGERRVVVEVEGHGREEVVEGADVSRTVGWFTTQYPVVLEVAGAQSVGEVVGRVKREVRAIPGRGMGYGLLRYLGGLEQPPEREEWGNEQRGVGEAAERVGEAREAGGSERRGIEVGFLYLGQVDQVLESGGQLVGARESAGATQSAEHGRQHLVEVTAVVSGGRLQVSWSYSRELHRSDTIARLAESFLTTLRLIINSAHSVETQAFSTSDLTEFGWDKQELDDIITKIGGRQAEL